MLRMGSCVRFCCHNIPSHQEWRLFPSLSALEFRCCRVIALANQKRLLTKKSAASRGTMIFAEKSSCSFTASCSFPQRVKKAEAIVVEPVKRKTSEFIVI